MKIKYCLKCKRIEVDDDKEYKCSNCGAYLIDTDFPVHQFNELTLEEQKKKMQDYLVENGYEQDTKVEKKIMPSDFSVSSSTTNQKSSGNGLQIAGGILIVFSILGALMMLFGEMGIISIVSGFVGVVTGMLVYAIGEICILLTQINNKLK